MNEISRTDEIAVLGDGVMGSRIALLCALHGHTVHLWTHSGDEAGWAGFPRMARVEGRLGGFGREQIADAVKRIHRSTEFNAISNARYVIESVTENKKIKADVLSRAEAVAVDTEFIATNTSALSLADLGQSLTRPERLIGLHFFNTPLKIPLVEVICGPSSCAQAIHQGTSLVESLGKNPLVVDDSPGFVVNRILFPMIAEAIRVAESTNTSLKEIDTAMKTGAALPVGPIELADYIGLDVCLSILESLNQTTPGNRYHPPELLRQHVNEGRLGRKSRKGFFDYP